MIAGNVPGKLVSDINALKCLFNVQTIVTNVRIPKIR